MQTQTINVYQFRYLQEEYGDVCTLINLINVLHFLNDHDSKLKLLSYLNEKKWNRYVKEIVQDKENDLNLDM